jgi:hypothetical protein
MKKNAFLIGGSVVMIILGILRGLGGISLLLKGNALHTDLPIVASFTQVKAVALGLVGVLLISSAIYLIIRKTKRNWNYCMTVLLLFFASGALNGLLLFGHPLDKGQMINIIAVLICCMILYLGRPSLSNPE